MASPSLIGIFCTLNLKLGIQKKNVQFKVSFQKTNRHKVVYTKKLKKRFIVVIKISKIH